MKEELVSFKVANLAKEKGFDFPCLYTVSLDPKLGKVYNSHQMDYIDWNNYIPTTNPSLGKCYISAPTQSLLQKWLREVHYQFVHVEHSSGCWNWVIENSKGYKEGKPPDQDIYPEFEEQLEIGLFEALHLIKNK